MIKINNMSRSQSDRGSSILSKIKSGKKILPLILIIFAVLLTGQACGTSYVDGGIFMSEDYGENWEQKTYVGQDGRKTLSISAANVRRIAFHPQEIITTENEDFSKTAVLYTTTYENGVYKTDNAADSWYPTNFQSGLFVDLVINSQEPDTIYTCSQNIIYKSYDGGQTWENVYTETQGGLIMKLLIDHYNPNTIYAFTSVKTVLKSEDAGANWHLIHTTEDYPKDAQMSALDSRIIFVRDEEGKLYRTTDAGANWDEPLDTKEHRELWPQGKIVNDFFLDPNNSSTILMATKQGLMRSNDLGNNWHQINTLIAAEDSTNTEIKNILVTPSKPEVIYFSIKNLIHKSDDGGITWRVLETFPSQREVKVMYVDPVNPAVIYVGTKTFDEEGNSFFPS